VFGLKHISRWQFACIRIALGGYLLIHFVLLIPYAGELFSSEGALGDKSLSPFFSGLPSPFWINDRSWVATGVLLSAAIASIALIVGWQRKWMAVLLLYVWACLFCRNPLIANPSLAYIGLILLLSVLVPCHETVRYGQSDAKKWYYPSGVYWVAWILLAVGYTFSGLIKLQSPSWIDGTALSHLIENPLARPGFVRDGLRILPENVLKMFTWGALIAEILYVPLSFFRRSRLWIWTVLVIMHLGLLLVVDFLDLTAAMLLIHLFTFDPEWFPAKKRNAKSILFYDGDCGLCTHSVQFFMEEDREQQMQFAPLQGETALSCLPESLRDTSALSTIVYYYIEDTDDEAKIVLRSNAILTALSDIGGFWRLPRICGKWIPKWCRDSIYNWIARHRLKLFPKGVCAIPSDDERARLLP
jgi:predicted DCC family thiol-disulfide oxidoreductase YuxK